MHFKPRCAFDVPALKAALAAWWASKRHLSTALFVLFLAYMPIVSASLRALDCIDPIAGVRYLRSDLSVECGVGQHAAARALSYTVLVALGAGFPAGLAWLLGTARDEQLADAGFHATWGFLFDGYRAPTRSLVPTTPGGGGSSDPRKSLGGARGEDGKLPLGVSTQKGGRRRSTVLPERLKQTWVVSGESRVWWEAVVLCRKAGVVLLAVTVTNPYLQCVGATLWFLGATALQLRYTPYAKPLFNRLETVSLVTTLLTAVISTALLQYNVGVTSSELHPPESMTGIEWTVTVALAVMNVGTFIALASFWLRAQCARAHGLVRGTALARGLSGRVASLRGKTIAAASPIDDASTSVAAAAAAASTINPLRLRVDAATTTPGSAPAPSVVWAPATATTTTPAGAAVTTSTAGAVTDTATELAAGSGDSAAATDTAVPLPTRAVAHAAAAAPHHARVIAFAATPAGRVRRK